jgi:hypothetical protein
MKGLMALVETQWDINLPLALHPFVALVLDQPHLQQRLAQIDEVDAFVAEAVLLAAEADIALDPTLLQDALRPDPLGLGRFRPAPINCATWPPSGWLPTRSIATGGGPAFDWMWLGARALTQPFFEDEVRRADALPFNWLFRIRTSLDTMVAGADSEDFLPLRGLIFHMSRCGSTLLAQMLAAVPANAVSSEPEPLDGVMQWVRLAPAEPEVAVAAIRAIVAALGRDRGTGATGHVIKLETWHVFSLPHFRAAFPAVNWVHLYRNGIEVMVSQMRDPGMHTIAGTLPASILGFAADPGMAQQDFTAAVLARVGETIIEHWPLGGGMIVAYPDIRDAASGPIAAHFSLSCDTQAMALMAAAAKRDAKAPQQGFTNDVSRKQAAATPDMESATQRWLLPVQAQLQRLAENAGEQ